jgi:NADH-quinone oxidoreductase subunit E
MAELTFHHEMPARLRQPTVEDLNLRFDEAAVAELEALKTHYPEWKACILPGLWIAQRVYGGFLSGDAIAEVAFRLKRSYAEVEGVATFYSLYNTDHVPGRHKLELCTCLSCHIGGTWDLRDYIRRKLGVGHGETTADGMFTFEEVECLNACDRAPVMQVGDKYYGPVTEQSFDQLIEQLRSTEESTVVQYAREVVNVQLRDVERPAAIPTNAKK